MTKSAGFERLSWSESARKWAPYWAALVLFIALSFAVSWYFRKPGDLTCTFSEPVLLPKPSPDVFSWAIVGELALVIYAYAYLAKEKLYREICLGLALWVGELAWEMVNALYAYRCGAPLFGLRGITAWQIYAGVNIEISLMFAMVPPVLFFLLPTKKEPFWGAISNRTAVACGLGLFCVAVEIMLNLAGALVWKWWFWRLPHLGLVAFFYCSPFLLLSWVHEKVTRLLHCILLLCLVVALTAISHLVFHTYLGWIRLY